MTPITTLFAVEVRRALARRLVRVLVGLALLAIAVTGVLAYVKSADFDPVLSPSGHVARLTSLWPAGGQDATLGATTVFLAIGALLAGASVTGAEWRAGTVATWCTWQPRRGRVLLARFAAAMVVAALVAVALQVLFALAVLPTVLLRGTTEGADLTWARGLAGGLARSAGLTAMAAGLGAAIASVGRNTSAALGAAFGYLAILEAIVRGLWPSRARWLVGENAAVFLTGHRLEDAPFSRGTVVAGLTLALYVGVACALAIEVFRRRDLAAGP